MGEKNHEISRCGKNGNETKLWKMEKIHIYRRKILFQFFSDELLVDISICSFFLF
jgi:hypothetical protein